MKSKVQRNDLPIGRYIFDLILLGNYDRIRYLLDPLTLHDRRMVTSQSVDGRSFLYLACELGHRAIAKYLLDQCCANIGDGFCFNNNFYSPMFAAVKKLDFAIIFLLMKYSDTLTLDNILDQEYYSIVNILGFYQNRVCGPEIYISKIDREVLVIRFYVLENYSERSWEFLIAAKEGELIKLKLILSLGVEINIRNSERENALCLAILNKRTCVKSFLVFNKLFSLASLINAYELCGAKLIAFQEDKAFGVQCWRSSIKLRQNNGMGFADKVEKERDNNLGKEFQTLEQLDRLLNIDDENIYIQALMVFLRLFPRTDNLVKSAVMQISQHKTIKSNLFRTIRIMSELYNINSGNISIDLSKKEEAVGLVNDFLDQHFNPEGTNGRMERFVELVQLMDLTKWEDLLKKNSFFQLVYEYLLSIVNRFIKLKSEFSTNDFEEFYVKTKISEMQKTNPNVLRTTLIHSAISRKEPFSVLEFLLKCTDDVNCFDFNRNTPLHLVPFLDSDVAYQFLLVKSLIHAGGHIDSMNAAGVRPMTELSCKYLIENPLNFLTLQCLAAQTIHNFDVPLSKKGIPQICVNFIKLHSNKY